MVKYVLSRDIQQCASENKCWKKFWKYWIAHNEGRMFHKNHERQDGNNVGNNCWRLKSGHCYVGCCFQSPRVQNAVNASLNWRKNKLTWHAIRQLFHCRRRRRQYGKMQKRGNTSCDINFDGSHFKQSTPRSSLLRPGGRRGQERRAVRDGV